MPGHVKRHDPHCTNYLVICPMATVYHVMINWTQLLYLTIQIASKPLTNVVVAGLSSAHADLHSSSPSMGRLATILQMIVDFPPAVPLSFPLNADSCIVNKLNVHLCRFPCFLVHTMSHIF